MIGGKRGIIRRFTQIKEGDTHGTGWVDKKNFSVFTLSQFSNSENSDADNVR